MPDPTVTEKPKPRRRRAKRPASDPTTPKKPRVTLLSRIEAMGPTHADAFRLIARGLPSFESDVRDALSADADMHNAHVDHLAALDAATKAGVALANAKERAEKGRVVLRKLDAMALRIAHEWGTLPTDDATAPTVAPASAAD